MKKFLPIIALLVLLAAPVAAHDVSTPGAYPKLVDLVREEVEVSAIGVVVDLGAAGLCYNEAYAAPWLLQRNDDVIVGNYVGDEPVFTGFVGQVTREIEVNDEGEEVITIVITADSSYRTPWGFVITEVTTVVDPWTSVVRTEVECR